MDETEMRALIAETLDMQARNIEFDGDDVPPARLNQPARAGDVERLESHFERCGARLPPSLRRFFSISDGVEGYMKIEELSLRSTRAIVESHASDDQWSDFAPLHELVIGSGVTSAFIGLDKTRPHADGEYPLVMVDPNGSRSELADFESFLLEQHEIQKNVLDANLADRDALKSD